MGTDTNNQVRGSQEDKILCGVHDIELELKVPGK